MSNVFTGTECRKMASKFIVLLVLLLQALIFLYLLALSLCYIHRENPTKS
ncbi:Uncharacterised protein [Vibrio cholerae]|nr:Uncharacterised protein [Vibrio cholerae]